LTHIVDRSLYCEIMIMWSDQSASFLTRDCSLEMLHSAALAVVRCLRVWLSVCHVCVLRRNG